VGRRPPSPKGRVLDLLVAPEIEAKLLIPDKATVRRLKSLIGRTIAVTDDRGREIEYVVERDKTSIYLDVNYDTKRLALFRGRRMLRERVRFDRTQNRYRFKKAVFQAKNGPVADATLHGAVFPRNEIRGEEYKSVNAFSAAKARLLGRRSNDAAVKYARSFVGERASLAPVLRIKDKRFFMRLRSAGKPKKGVPDFFVSIDRVKYRGLVGRKGKAIRLELEIEVIDDLLADKRKAQRDKLALVNAVTEHFAREFGLVPSPESKFESGVQLTIL
jgi:hypothetical protein